MTRLIMIRRRSPQPLDAHGAVTTALVIISVAAFALLVAVAPGASAAPIVTRGAARRMLLAERGSGASPAAAAAVAFPPAERGAAVEPESPQGRLLQWLNQVNEAIEAFEVRRRGQVVIRLA